MDILEPLPKFGVGARVSKEKWHDDSFWHIVHVNPKKKAFISSDNGSQRLAANIYGIKYWNGQAESGRIERIRGQMKQIWRRVGLDEDLHKLNNVVAVLEREWQDQVAEIASGTTPETPT